MAVAFSRACISGSATLTTVPSMNAMAEPMMVAARTQGPEVLAHGAEAPLDLTTPSSHGGLRTAMRLLLFQRPPRTKTLAVGGTRPRLGSSPAREPRCGEGSARSV